MRKHSSVVGEPKPGDLHRKKLRQKKVDIAGTKSEQSKESLDKWLGEGHGVIQNLGSLGAREAVVEVHQSHLSENGKIL